MSNRLHSDAGDSSLSYCLPPVITQNMWFPISPEIPTFLFTRWVVSCNLAPAPNSLLRPSYLSAGTT